MHLRGGFGDKIELHEILNEGWNHAVCTHRDRILLALPTSGNDSKMNIPIQR